MSRSRRLVSRESARADIPQGVTPPRQLAIRVLPSGDPGWSTRSGQPGLVNPNGVGQPVVVALDPRRVDECRSVVEHGEAEAPQVVVEGGRVEGVRIERPLRESLDPLDALPVLGV